MGDLMKTHLAFLQVLASSLKNQTTTLLKSMTKGQMNAICEILINIRYGNIPLSDKDKKRLHRKRDLIRELTTKTTTQKVRRTIIQKEGTLIVSMLKNHIDFLKTRV